MIYCVLRNHDFVNEVQVTAQVFFPSEKFSFGTEISETGFSVVSDISSGSVYKDGVRLSHHFFKLGPTADYLNERRAVMLALFHALKEAVPTATPWGALTGIRPS
jgi:hypothetical protein